MIAKIQDWTPEFDLVVVVEFLGIVGAGVTGSVPLMSGSH
jgi:hypothetical protein